MSQPKTSVLREWGVWSACSVQLGQCVIGEKEKGALWRPGIEESFRERVDAISMVSYRFVFGLLTLAFWWWQHKSENLHAKNEQPPGMPRVTKQRGGGRFSLEKSH